MEFAVKNLSLTFEYKVNFNNKQVTKDLNCINEISNYSAFGIGPMYPRDANRLLEADGTFVSYYSSYEHQPSDDHSSVYRVTPPDSFRIQALLDIVRTLGWKRLSVISSYGENGHTAASHFIERLEKAHSCLDQHLELPWKKSTKKFKKISKLNSSAIISFTMGQDTVNVIRYINRNKRQKPQLLFAFGSMKYGEISEKTVANGSLFLDFPLMPVPALTEYLCKNNCGTFNGSQPLPVWCEERHSNFSLCDKIPVICKHACNNNNNLFKSNKSLLTCCESENFNSSIDDRIRSKQVLYFFSPVYQVMKAVQVLIEALESSAKDDRKYLGVKARQKLVRNYLRNHSHCNYAFPANYTVEDNIIKYDVINLITYGSSYYLARVGSWSQNRSECDDGKSGELVLNVTDINWMSTNEGRTNYNVSGISCNQNEVPRRRDGVTLGTCWECIRCKQNDIVTNDSCWPCRRDEKPDRSYRKCNILPRKVLGIKTNWQAKLIVGFTLIGIGVVLCVVFMFIKYKNSKVIKASGRELSMFILLGAVLTFLNSFIFISPPGNVNCSLRQILPGLAFCLCYGPLFLKVNRIYRIFSNAKQLEKTHMASTLSQVLLVLGIVVFQLIPGCAWILKSVPNSVIAYPDHRNYVVLHCPFDHVGFFLNLILGVVFMLGSTWYAFKTRAFPGNFNESKYIGISLYIICVCWALFIPSMLFVKPSNEFLREYMICSICIMVGKTVLGGLFIPKVKRLLNPSAEKKTTMTFSHGSATSVVHDTSFDG